LFCNSLPEAGTLVPKHVGILMIVLTFLNVILLSAFIGGYIDKNLGLQVSLLAACFLTERLCPQNIFFSFLFQV